MANYGDVALGLKPEWNRNNYEHNKWMLYTIGHNDGKAEVFLKADPEARYQFRWVDPKDEMDVTDAFQSGYVYVEKDTWEKVEGLWSWNAENKVGFQSQILMARPVEKWLTDQKRRDGQVTKARADSDADLTRHAPKGAEIIEDRPRTRRRGI